MCHVQRLEERARYLNPNLVWQVIASLKPSVGVSTAVSLNRDTHVRNR